MKIEIEVSEERMRMLLYYADRNEISIDALINVAITENLRKQGAYSKRKKRNIMTTNIRIICEMR